MNKEIKEILEKLGFDKEVKMVEQGCCPMCRCLIDLEKFRDGLSEKEYKISGLCQKYQDSVFN